jgi:hypothetical protein
MRNGIPTIRLTDEVIDKIRFSLETPVQTRRRPYCGTVPRYIGVSRVHPQLGSHGAINIGWRSLESTCSQFALCLTLILREHIRESHRDGRGPILEGNQRQRPRKEVEVADVIAEG